MAFEDKTGPNFSRATGLNQDVRHRFWEKVNLKSKLESTNALCK